MKGFNFSSIRARLMFLVLIAILPALGLTLYTATEHRHQAAAEAQQEALRLVRLASQDQEVVISRTRQLLAVMVQLPEVRSGNSAACNLLFSRVMENYPLYAVFGLINTDGSLSCSFPQAKKPVKLWDRQYFQTVLKTKDFAIGDYSINRVTGKPSLQLAYPVLNEAGHVKSVLFVSVNLTWLNQLASKAELPRGASVTMIDRNGTILSRHPDPEKWVGKTMPEAAIIRTVLGVKSEGTVKSTGVDGVPKLYAYKPLNGPDKEANLYIYSGFPEKVVLADANRMLARNLAAMGMEAVTVLLLAWVGGKIFFLRRIQDLLESTRRLARGELQARTDLRYDKGELGQLSRSFDEMAGILALRESQLNETNAKYRTLVEQIPAITYVFSTENIFTVLYISPQIEQITGYRADEIIKKPQLWLDIIIDGDRQRFSQDRRSLLADGRPICSEYRIRSKDNRIVWLHDEARAVSDGSGQFSFLQGFILDISGQKIAAERIRQDASRTRELADISRKLAEAGANYMPVLHDVVRRIAKLFRDACIIRLLSEDGQFLKPVAVHHQDKESLAIIKNMLSGPPHPSDSEPYCQVMQTGMPLIINSISQEHMQSLAGLCPYIEQLNVRRILVTPLRVQGRAIGTLCLSRNGSEDLYSHEDQLFLQNLADRVALAIVNARLFSRNHNQLRTITALYNSARKLGQNLNLERLAEDVCRTCVEKYEVKLARLATAESDGSVRLLEQHPPDTEFPAVGINIRWDNTSPGQGPTGRAIRSESPVVINDLAGEPAGEPWIREMLAKGYLSLAALPLVSRDKVFGVLNLYNDKPGFFNPARIEFFQAYVHQAAAALENARLYSEAQQRYERLGALRNIDLAITGSLDLRVTFNVILDQVTSQLGIDAAAILLLNPYTQLLEFAAGRGFHTSGIKHTVRRMGEGNPGFAALERQTIHISNLPEARETFTRYTLLEKENFIAYYGVPLVAKGLVKGVLEIFHRAPLDPNREWLEFLNTLAGQAAIAIDNAALFSDLQRSNIKLTLAYDATIEGWSRALDLRDKETEGHSRRVTDMTVALAQAMGMSEADLVHIRRGALLHDIGKMGVPDHILLKPGPLTDEEWRIMRRHPVYAYEMLSPIAYLLPAMDIPYCHHEKWDGTGYPRGLIGEQIPLPARIFSLVDVWDAMCSDRPYRKAWSREKARDYISSLAGTHFDSTIVELFLKME